MLKTPSASVDEAIQRVMEGRNTDNLESFACYSRGGSQESALRSP